MVRMLVAKPLRNQHLDRVAEQLVASVTEEFLGLRVDQRDAEVATEDQLRVRRGFEQVVYLVLGPLTLGDIADRAGDERALLGFERAQADLDGKRSEERRVGEERRSRGSPDH